MMRVSNIFLLGAGLLTLHVTAGRQLEGGAVMERCKDNAGGDIVSADSCQELAGCRWAQSMATGGSGCIRDSTYVWEQRKLDGGSSCPVDTIATFTGLTTSDGFGYLSGPYLGLIWTNGRVIGADMFPVSGYNTIATNSSGFAGFNNQLFDIVITSATPDCPWGIGTLIAASAWNFDLDVTFTGTRANQADCVVQVVLPSPFVVTPIDLSSCGLLTSLKISSRGGTNAGIPGGTGANLAFSNVQIVTVPPPESRIAISAASYKGRSSVRLDKTYNLLVTLNLPPATGADGRMLTKASTDKHALNSTTYALLLDIPGTGNVTYKHTSVRPWLKPASLKKPVTQTGGDLLWANVPMPLYASKDSTRTFKVTFKVNKGAISPLMFLASVWKDGIKLQTATPVQVKVTGK